MTGPARDDPRAEAARAAVARIFVEEYGRVLATLIGAFGDFELAETALQEAFTVAVERWSEAGLPPNPAGWIVTTARRKAIDRLRREANLARKQADLADQAAAADDPPEAEVTDFPDERLKLIFTCCHPALPPEAQVALTLHTLGGLSTQAIAHAFLVSETTLAQRLVRAKRKIKQARIPYRVPPLDERPERLATVLAVLYLIFNEGYRASTGERLMRLDLSAEAIRLARVLAASLAADQLAPPWAEAQGLLALMLLHHSRRTARSDAAGELVSLDDQDRGRWDQPLIAEGLRLLDEALALRHPGPYQIQAAISALHAQAANAAETDWLQIAALYGELARRHPSPVVVLNQAVARGMAYGPAEGLALLEQLEAAGHLREYQPLYAAQADLFQRAGRLPEARAAYARARALAGNDVERRFIQRRLDTLTATETDHDQPR